MVVHTLLEARHALLVPTDPLLLPFLFFGVAWLNVHAAVSVGRYARGEV